MSTSINPSQAPSDRSTTSSVPLNYNYNGNPSKCVIMALVEGRGNARGEVGMSVHEFGSPFFTFSQFSDSFTYTKLHSQINIYSPTEVILPSSLCDINGAPSALFTSLKTHPSLPIIPVHRRFYNSEEGTALITSLSYPIYLNGLLERGRDKYYGLAAIGGLLGYLETARSITFAPFSLRIQWVSPSSIVAIDRATACSLELVSNINDSPSSKENLFSILNTCRTITGSKQLRMNILQPSTDIGFIERRLDCISELSSNTEVLYGLMNILNQFPQEIDHLISFLVKVTKGIETVQQVESRLNYIIYLKQIVTVIPLLVEILQKSSNDYFNKLRKELESPIFVEIHERIKSVITEDSKYTKSLMAMEIQRVFAINSNINPLLDIARRAFIEIQQDANVYVENLAEKYELNFRLHESTTQGFFIQCLTNGPNFVLPNTAREFLHVRRRKNVVSFTTETMIFFDRRIKEILLEITSISNTIVNELIREIRSSIGSLYFIVDVLGELDVLYALTTFALSDEYIVRPKFSPYYTTLNKSRHPILQSLPHLPLVSNSIVLTNESNILIITGPNMSGKTTLLKQMALLQILAQIGSYVPAQDATFRIADSIFARIGSDDSVDNNLSAFIVEMEEMSHMLKNVSDSSIVLIDELGRGTNSSQGNGLAISILDSLAQLSAFVLFSTHYPLLSLAHLHLPNVLNYTLVTKEEVEEESHFHLKFTHVLKRGVSDLGNYGLKLCQNSRFPKSVTQRALEIAQESAPPPENGAESDEVGEKLLKKSIMELMYTLFLFSESEAVVNKKLSSHELRLFLSSLQHEFLNNSNN